MADYDVIILGMGLAGLTSGAVLAKNGASVLGIERRKKTGGLITSFERKGMPFVNLAGSLIPGGGEQGFVTELLRYLDVADDAVTLIPIKTIGTYFFPDGTFIETCDVQKTQQELFRKFPEERDAIIKYYELVDALYAESMGMMFRDLTPADMVSFPLKCPNLIKYGGKTVEEFYYNHFEDEVLIAHLLAPANLFLTGPLMQVSFAAVAIIIGMMYRMGPNLIKGGTYNLPKALTASFEVHGGQLKTNAAVTKIGVEKDHVVGVELDNGETITARHIISCVDSYQTFKKFIGDEYLPKKLAEKLDAMVLGHGLAVVYLGIDKPPQDIGITPGGNVYVSSYSPKTWWDTETRNILFNRDGSFILTNLATEQTTAWSGGITQVMMTKPLIKFPKTDLSQYKEQIIEAYLDNLENIMPDVRKHIVMRDCFTPQDFAEFGRLPRGAMGWESLPSQSGQNGIGQKTFLKNLYLAGQWTAPGKGMISALFSGMEAARHILKDERNFMAVSRIEAYRALLL